MKTFLIVILSFIFGMAISLIIRYGLNQKFMPLAKNNLPNPTHFSLINPPDKSVNGKILFLSGNVFWENRIATQPSKLILPTPIEQGEELYTKNNGQISINFPNFGTITLLPNSNLDIIQTLPENLVILQNKGKAVYQKQGNNAFSIRTFNLLINLKQGESVVNINLKTQTATINVEKGLITTAFIDSQGNTDTLNVYQKQSFIFNNNTSTGAVQ